MKKPKKRTGPMVVDLPPYMPPEVLDDFMDRLIKCVDEAWGPEKKEQEPKRSHPPDDCCL